MDLLARLPAQGRVAVVRALQLGDMLCAVPALRSLRAALPNSQITLIGLPWAREFVARYSAYLDDFLEFPGYPGIPERAMNAAAVADFFKQAQQREFDLAIQLHGSGQQINPFTLLLGAKRSAGFYVPSEYLPDPETFTPWPQHGHEIERLNTLIHYLGGPDRGDALEFPITAADRSEADEIVRRYGLRPGGYVCLHPGGRMLSRRWSVDKFTAVGRWLERQGLRVVVTGAPFEKELADELAERLGTFAVNVAGQTTLGGMAVLLAACRVLVSNDTGVSHIAAGLEVPSVVIVLGSDPARWAPLNRRLHRIVLGEVECRPCGHFECPIGFSCERLVEPADVIAAIEAQLAESPVNGNAPNPVSAAWSVRKAITSVSV